MPHPLPYPNLFQPIPTTLHPQPYTPSRVQMSPSHTHAPVSCLVRNVFSLTRFASLLSSGALEYSDKSKSDRPLQDMYVLDLRTRQWTQIVPQEGNEWPPPRGFGCLALYTDRDRDGGSGEGGKGGGKGGKGGDGDGGNHDGRSLFLWGGRTSWSWSASPPLSDMWRFDIGTGVWTCVAAPRGAHAGGSGGEHVASVSPQPHAMVGNHWYIVEPTTSGHTSTEDTRLVLRRYSVSENRWDVVGRGGVVPSDTKASIREKLKRQRQRRQKGGGGGGGTGRRGGGAAGGGGGASGEYVIGDGHNGEPPNLTQNLCGWFQDGRMYVWGVRTTDVSGGKPATLHYVDVETGQWGAFALGRTADSESLPCLTGSTMHTFVEGGACFDPVSRKAYIYGGWNEDYYFIEADARGRHDAPRMLSGRYYGSLLEISIDNMLLRAVEGAATSKGKSNNQNLRTGSVGGSPGLRGFAFVAAHTWENAAPGEAGAEAAGGRQSRVVVGGGYTTFNDESRAYEGVKTLGDVHMCNLFEEGTIEGKAVDALGGRHSTNPNHATVRRFNLTDIYEAARFHLVKNMEVRRQVSGMHPVGRRGALVGRLLATDVATGEISTVQPQQFYDRLEWHTAAEVEARFPNMKDGDPDTTAQTWAYFDTQDPCTHVLVFYVASEDNDIRQMPAHDREQLLGGRNGKLPGDKIFVGYYGRYNPHGVYYNREETVAQGRFVVSTEAFEVDPATTSPFEVREEAVTVCANSDCPTRFRDMLEKPTLTLCSACRIVKYCSRECQKVDRKRHKKMCKLATGD